MYAPILPTVIHVYFWIFCGLSVFGKTGGELGEIYGVLLILLLLDVLRICFGVINGVLVYRFKRIKDNWFLRLLRCINISVILWLLCYADIPLSDLDIVFWLSISDWVLHKLITLLNMLKCRKLAGQGDISVGGNIRISERGIERRF